MARALSEVWIRRGQQCGVPGFSVSLYSASALLPGPLQGMTGTSSAGPGRWMAPEVSGVTGPENPLLAFGGFCFTVLRMPRETIVAVRPDTRCLLGPHSLCIDQGALECVIPYAHVTSILTDEYLESVGDAWFVRITVRGAAPFMLIFHNSEQADGFWKLLRTAIEAYGREP